MCRALTAGQLKICGGSAALVVRTNESAAKSTKAKRHINSPCRPVGISPPMLWTGLRKNTAVKRKDVCKCADAADFPSPCEASQHRSMRHLLRRTPRGFVKRCVNEIRPGRPIYPAELPAGAAGSRGPGP